HLRQLRSVQPGAPRIVSAIDPRAVQTWGEGENERNSGRVSNTGKPVNAHAVLNHVAQILAAGAQPIVMPFHAGTNFGFLGGRVTGTQGGFVATSAAADAPLGEGGERGERYNALRRIITFANNFSHVFADLDPDYHPIVLDPDEAITGEFDATAQRRGANRA